MQIKITVQFISPHQVGQVFKSVLSLYVIENGACLLYVADAPVRLFARLFDSDSKKLARHLLTGKFFFQRFILRKSL